MAKKKEASKKKKVQPTYQIVGKVMVEVAVEITALDLDDAVAKAKAMKPEDFVTINGGDIWDVEHSIKGIYKI